MRKIFKMVITIIILIGLVLPIYITKGASTAIAASSPTPSVLFEDSFDDPIIGPDWTIIQGSWEIIDGELYTDTASPSGATLPIIKAGELSWANYILKFDFTPSYAATAAGPVVYGFICHQRDDIFYEEWAPNKYRAVTGYSLDVGSEGEVKISRHYCEGVEGALIAFDTGYSLAIGSTYTIKFGRSEDTVFAKVWQKGTTEPDWQLTTSDASYLYGKIALGTWQTKGYFDNVRVYSSETEAPTPNGEGCFIATAAYGSYLDSHVETLQNFRDRYMMTNPVGSALVSLYYKLSPPVAEFIDDHPPLKPIVRVGLLPAVALSEVAVSTTSAEKAAIVGSLLLVSASLIIWFRRKAVQGQ